MIAAWLTLGVALAAPTVTIEPPPAPGVASTVVVTDEDGAPVPGVTLKLVHRPGLPGQREQAAGITDSTGKVHLTPDTSGLTDLVIDDVVVRRFSVAWPWPPPSVVVPLGLVLLAALGTVAVGVRR